MAPARPAFRLLLRRGAEGRGPEVLVDGLHARFPFVTEADGAAGEKQTGSDVAAEDTAGEISPGKQTIGQA
jgi:hypothetical protein